MLEQIFTQFNQLTTDELLTVGLLVVAFVQAVLFIFQLKLMRGSLRATQGTIELMRDNAHHQLRAYIDIDRAWIEFPEPATPKATVRDCRKFCVTPPDNFEMASSTLGANNTHEMFIEHPQPIVKPCLFDKIGSEDATIYVYGSIQYKDVFGEKHETTYRLMHGGPNGAIEGRLRPCSEGNEIT